MLKPFKYFAYRVADAIVIRRSVKGIRKCVSVLKSKSAGDSTTIVMYAGGVVLGSMPVSEWVRRTSKSISAGGCLKIEKELYIGIKPFLN